MGAVKMRYIGLDVGDKRIGVSMSDLLGFTAQGVETIHRKSNQETFDRIAQLINENDVTKLVVGLPKNMDGSLGEQGKKVQNFMDKFLKHTEIEIIYWDERLTSAAAHKMLITADVNRNKRKKVVDKIAAIYILQGYLDRIR